MNNQHKTAELALAKLAISLAAQKASGISPSEGNSEKVYNAYHLLTAAYWLVVAAEVGDLGSYRNEKVGGAIRELKYAYYSHEDNKQNPLPIYVDIVIDDGGLVASENVSVRMQSLPVHFKVHTVEEEDEL